MTVTTGLDLLVEEHVHDPGGYLVRAYLSTLRSGQSRDSMRGSLAAVVRLVAELTGRDDLPTNVAVRAAQLDWALLDPGAARAIRAAMVGRWSASTCNRHVAAVRGVVRSARALGVMPRERAEMVLENLPSVRAEYDGPDPFARLVAPAELERMFAFLAGRDAPIARRDAAILAVLAATAVRRSEVAALDLSDYQGGTGEMLVRRGKGGRRRKAWLHDGAREAVDAWLAVRGPDTGPLFVAIRKGGTIVRPFAPMSANAAWRRLRGIAAGAGVPHLAPHDLRRMVATGLLADGVDVLAVRHLLGHASVATTARYDRRGESAARRASEHVRVPYVAPGDPPSSRS